jgi:hypothetical protein
MISTGIAVAISLLVKSAPSWLPIVSDAVLTPARDAFFGKLTERGFDKGMESGRKLLRLDEREQTRHLELALKNAAERGAASFQTLPEQQQYSDVLTTLSQPGSLNDQLRREALRLFTLDAPDLTMLNTLYQDALRSRSQGETTQAIQGMPAIDATPYLSGFFDALIKELYIDPLFHDRISDALKVQANMSMQRSLTEVVETLRHIYGTLEHGYTTEQFEQDVQVYAAHMERTLRYLKLVGVVPKERTHENRDPELDGIFVPLRVKSASSPFAWDFGSSNDAGVPLIQALEQSSYLVLLGGPGSGKSTAIKHLAWSHAANLAGLFSPADAPILPGNPLPLRIELRRLNEDRRVRPDYDFLTYASEVLLERANAGVKNPWNMFEILLERRMMLVLFDGLDEVATLSERRTLVEEIESFAQQYPGNHFLVTSRPVGYDLAPLSGEIFSSADVQPFNDEQIHTFLERWYNHVLRLSPLSLEETEELELLFSALKDNPRLHDLAENPLLLTVITALHRYERLPDRRIQVYDRCADLLLETWAKLRGTDVRWRDLQLSKEDQYASVARLGFVLHERAQEQIEQDTFENNFFPDNRASKDVDVSSRFMLQQIEQFFEQQKLFATGSEEHKQAERFLALIQEEAGLIVERGTDEDGKSLYGFVHRTFQEYFAAADVYQRYLQEEDPEIIRVFLVQHLHDNPHWHEVILLLFGKLGRKPATRQLRQILNGQLKSRRSRFTDILQQNLFFVCTCLAEDIQIENDLADAVVTRFGELIVTTPFSSQRGEALQLLEGLTKTRQYSEQARQALKRLVKQEEQQLDTGTLFEAAIILVKSSRPATEERVEALQTIKHLITALDISIEYYLAIAWNLYENTDAGRSDQEARQFASQMLIDLALRPDLDVDAALQAAHQLPRSLVEEEIEDSLHFDSNFYFELAKRPDLSVRQAILVAQYLYKSNISDLEVQRVASQLLLNLLHRSDLSFREELEAAMNLHQFSLIDSDEQRSGAQFLVNLAHRPELPVEEAIRTAQDFSNTPVPFSSSKLKPVRSFNLFLHELASRIDLSVEYALQIIQSLDDFNLFDTEEEQFTSQMRNDLAQRPNLTVEQTIKIARSYAYPFQQQIGAQMLVDLLHHPDLTTSNTLEIAKSIYQYSQPDSEHRSLAVRLLVNLSMHPDLSVENTIEIAEILNKVGQPDTEEWFIAIQLFVNLAQRPDQSTEQRIETLLKFYLSSASPTDSPPGNSSSSPEDDAALRLLVDLARRADLPVEQTILAAQPVLQPYSSEEWHDITSISLPGQNFATLFFLELARRSGLTSRELVLIAQNLKKFGEKPIADQLLTQVAQNSDLEIEERLKAVELLFESSNTWNQRNTLIQQAESLLSGEKLSQFLEKHWISMIFSNAPTLADVPSLLHLAMSPIMPAQAKDEIYSALSALVPQFDKLGEPDE